MNFSYPSRETRPQGFKKIWYCFLPCGKDTREFLFSFCICWFGPRSGPSQTRFPSHRPGLAPCSLSQVGMLPSVSGPRSLVSLCWAVLRTHVLPHATQSCWFDAEGPFYEPSHRGPPLHHPAGVLVTWEGRLVFTLRQSCLSKRWVFLQNSLRISLSENTP